MIAAKAFIFAALMPEMLCAASALQAGAASSAAPPSWIGIVDTTGRCFYAVPPTWRFDDREEANTLSSGPGGNAVVAQSWKPLSSWTTFVSRLRGALKPTVVYDDSFDRFWIEYPSGPPGVHYYVAVRAEGGACVTQIDVRPGANAALRAVVKDIVLTIAASR